MVVNWLLISAKWLKVTPHGVDTKRSGGRSDGGSSAWAKGQQIIETWIHVYIYMYTYICIHIYMYAYVYDWSPLKIGDATEGGRNTTRRMRCLSIDSPSRLRCTLLSPIGRCPPVWHEKLYSGPWRMSLWRVWQRRLYMYIYIFTYIYIHIYKYIYNVYDISCIIYIYIYNMICYF